MTASTRSWLNQEEIRGVQMGNILRGVAFLDMPDAELDGITHSDLLQAFTPAKQNVGSKKGAGKRFIPGGVDDDWLEDFLRRLIAAGKGTVTARILSDKAAKRLGFPPKRDGVVAQIYILGTAGNPRPFEISRLELSADQPWWEFAPVPALAV